MSLLKKIKRHIKTSQIISFDIFDTLLLRPYLKPTDLFYHIELIYKEKGFAQKRIESEIKARNNFITSQNQEISIDEIYFYMPENLKKYKNLELNFEKDILYKNKEIDEVYQYALANNKKIFIISDTYIPRNIIEEILLSKNIYGWDELFVSSEIKLTKNFGDLYQYIKTLYPNKKKWIHIGDNKVSDVHNAKKNGIQAIHYKQVKIQFLLKNKRIQKILKNIKKEEPKIQLDLSILIMINAILFFEHNLKNSFINIWELIGERFAGPMNFSFAKWIEKKCIDFHAKDILFIARDGYFLNKIFKLFKNNINSYYFYASRAIISNINQDKENNYKTFFSNYINNKYVVVDVGTNSFTSQKFLKKYNPNILGLYWCTGKDTKENYYKFYNDNYKNTDKFFATTLIEFFMTSPEGCIEDLSKKFTPIYKKMNNVEKYRSYALSKMEKGILRFSNKCIEIFGEKNILQTPESIIIWSNLLLLEPTSIEAFVMNKIYHAIDKEHTKYHPSMNLKINRIIQILNTIRGHINEY